MTRLIFLFTLLCSHTLAQALPLDDYVFQNCEDVLSRAVEYSGNVHESAYLLELYPKNQGRVGPPFPSEMTATYATRWLASHDPKTLPYALFYFVKDSYTLRCRDDRGRFAQLSGPFGSHSTLDMKSVAGRAEIWHFYFTPTNVAHVFVIAETPVDALDGQALMAQVKELLNARYLFLYVRNDPWFLDVAPNPLPYLFTDSFKRITEREYQETRMLTCYSNSGCKVALGLH
jgi:hypothetical protein